MGRRYRKGPVEPKPAPGELAIVQAFVNTASAGDGAEVLATPAALGRWLSRHKLLDADIELDESQRHQGLDLRAGLRAWIVDPGEATGSPTLRRIEENARRARFELRYDDAGRPTDFGPASGSFDDALGALAAIAVRAQHEDLWSRLKLCALGSCRRAFFDSGPSRTGRWCTPRCGYRVRAAAYRRAHSRR